MGRIVQIINKELLSLFSFFFFFLYLNAMFKRIRKIPKCLTVYVTLYFYLGTGQRSQDPSLKRNGVKVPGDRRMENGVSA